MTDTTTTTPEGRSFERPVEQLSRMEQLLAFCDWERQHNPGPPGKQHIAEWAAVEIERLHLEVNRMTPIEIAARNLVKVKGRYHTEQAFKTLAALLVNTTDEPRTK